MDHMLVSGECARWSESQTLPGAPSQDWAGARTIAPVAAES
jgi:hypothetical protein